MVSSYLICDLCGRFGPPAGFLSQDGLRLCYQCWYEARRDSESATPDEPAPAADAEAGPAEKDDTGREPR
jgi:recombinational DNA repair protein (RecF pathway)